MRRLLRVFAWYRRYEYRCWMANLMRLVGGRGLNDFGE